MHIEGLYPLSYGCGVKLLSREDLLVNLWFLVDVWQQITPFPREASLKGIFRVSTMGKIS